MTDPYHRPILRVVIDYTSEVIHEGITAYRGEFYVENIEHEPIHFIVRKDARHISGVCFGEVKLTNRTQQPCIWLHWGDPDGVEDHQIHVGNYPAESTGCPLPGLDVTESGVGRSRDAMSVLYWSLVLTAGYGDWAESDGDGYNYSNPPFGLIIGLIFETKEQAQPVDGWSGAWKTIKDKVCK